MNNILAFIPARGGSKSIPRKNIKELGGKPLIAWTIESAFGAGIERVMVNTDDDEIARIARQHGAEVVMRPPELAQDDTPMFRVLQHEVPRIEPAPELVLLLQPTSPFRKKTHIQTALSLLSRNLDDYDSLISAERVPDKWHPAQVIVNTHAGPRMASGVPIAQRITRRQEHPEAWVPTGSIYLFKTANLEGGSLYGERVMILETDSEVNINNQDDWNEAELLLTKKSHD